MANNMRCVMPVSFILLYAAHVPVAWTQGLAAADHPPLAVSTSGSVADIADIQQRRLTFEAMTQLNQAKNAYEQTSRVEDRGASGVPVVRSVQGVGKRLFAVLAYSGGAQAIAHVGEDVPGGYRVKSVGIDRVLLSRSGQDFQLTFSESAPTQVPEPNTSRMPPFQGSSIPASSLR